MSESVLKNSVLYESTTEKTKINSINESKISQSKVNHFLRVRKVKLPFNKRKVHTLPIEN